ncbi:uncharacterized protein [Prorops nasuta]|uniref:uncharacterized protein n=1 Tax=Prorops nasuta TaxID=863751 RepID=UPI0034CFF5BB
MNQNIIDKELFVDPLGFSNQTAMVLRGLHGESLITEAKKLNLCTDDLHHLTEDDFIVLGANAELSQSLVRELSVLQKNKNKTVTTENKNCSQILKAGANYLSLVNSFVTYTRCRLEKQTNNFFLDEDKCFSAAKGLVTSTDATLAELNVVQKGLKDLKNTIKMQK